jgi:hypothetical protein
VNPNLPAVFPWPGGRESLTSSSGWRQHGMGTGHLFSLFGGFPNTKVTSNFLYEKHQIIGREKCIPDWFTISANFINSPVKPSSKLRPDLTESIFSENTKRHCHALI